MERRELLERLAPLIPPPRSHQVRYHGVLAPCASGRDRVVPRWARPSLVAPSTSAVRDPGSQSAKNVDPPRRTAWADLLQRAFEVDALRCPECGGRMRILSAITEPDVARRILACLDLPSRAPPLGSSPEASRSAGGELASEIAWGEWDQDGGFDFDQSLPGDGAIGPDG